MDRPGRGVHAAFGAVALASALVAVGCRAILGVHDFDEAASSDGAPPDSDAAADSGVDTGIGPDGCSLDDDPRDPTLLSNATQVVTGDSFSCALLSDGGVVCWGDNTLGQFGVNPPGKPPNSGKPQAVPLGFASSAPASIAAGDAHLCVTLQSGEIICWGDNSRAQSVPSNLETIAVPTILTAEQVSAPHAGADHTCAVFSDAGGQIYCWGDHRDLELGSGVDSGGPFIVRDLRNGGSLFTSTEVAVGDGHACARLADAGAVCWGNGENDQLGIGYLDGGSLPKQAFAGTAISAIRAGGNDTCVKTESGFLCVGVNADGQIERGGTSNVASPSAYDLLDGAADLTLANHHSCAWTADGRLYCFGDDKSGELGDNGAGGGAVIGIDGGASFGPVMSVATWSTPTGTSSGQSREHDGGVSGHTCAIIGHTCGGDGTVYCWGSNSAGQLGNGSVGGTPQLMPKAVVAP